MDELGLRETVRDIRSRVDAAVGEFGDSAVVAAPGRLARIFAPVAVRLAAATRLGRV
jgi:hypothetical protein